MYCLLPSLKTREFWRSKANWRLRFSLPSIILDILADLVGNTSLLRRVQKVMVCDLWLVDLDPFCVFLCFKVCCLWSLNYDWIRVFLKSAVRGQMFLDCFQLGLERAWFTNFLIFTHKLVTMWNVTLEFGHELKFDCANLIFAALSLTAYRSPYISFHAFTWDRPKNELRLVWLRVGRWPDASYFRTGLRLYRSHVKRKRISDRVHK